MDFRLSEEQVMLLRTCRDFAIKEVRPACREVEQMPYDEFIEGKKYPWHLLHRAQELGLRTSGWPVEYGGAGFDLLTQGMVLEELSVASASFAFDIQHASTWGQEIPHFSKELKDELLPKLRDDPTFITGHMVSEECGNTEFFLMYDAPGAAIHTFAERKGDVYVINGHKQFVSHANQPPKLYELMVRTDKNGPVATSCTAFFLPFDLPGITVGKAHSFLGLRMGMCAEVFLDNVRVPVRYRVGEENQGIQRMERVFNAENCYKDFICVGLLRAMYEMALDYAKTRVVCGKPIIEHPTIKLLLGDMRAKITAARGLVWRNAWNLDYRDETEAQKKYNVQMIYATKSFINQIGTTIMAAADEIHGGYGTEKSLDLEKVIRDFFTMIHSPVSTSVGYLLGAPTPDLPTEFEFAPV